MARPTRSRTSKAIEPLQSTESAESIEPLEEASFPSTPEPEEGFEYPPPPELSDDPFSTITLVPERGLESTHPTAAKTAKKPEPGPYTQVRWTYEMEEGLFSTLLEKVRSGKRADSGFKLEAWTEALEVVKSTAPITMRPLLTIEKLKNKELNTKAQYKDWKWLIGQSGFGIHPETRCVTASDEAWSEVLKVCLFMVFIVYLLRE